MEKKKNKKKVKKTRPNSIDAYVDFTPHLVDSPDALDFNSETFDVQNLVAEILSVFSEKIAIALHEKSISSNIRFEVLEDIFLRGVADWYLNPKDDITKEQWAFGRVNSFISKGKAYTIDSDLHEEMNITEGNVHISVMRGTKHLFGTKVMSMKHAHQIVDKWRKYHFAKGTIATVKHMGTGQSQHLEPHHKLKDLSVEPKKNIKESLLRTVTRHAIIGATVKYGGKGGGALDIDKTHKVARNAVRTAIKNNSHSAVTKITSQKQQTADNQKHNFHYDSNNAEHKSTLSNIVHRTANDSGDAKKDALHTKIVHDTLHHNLGNKGVNLTRVMHGDKAYIKSTSDHLASMHTHGMTVSQAAEHKANLSKHFQSALSGISHNDFHKSAISASNPKQKTGTASSPYQKVAAAASTKHERPKTNHQSTTAGYSTLGGSNQSHAKPNLVFQTHQQIQKPVATTAPEPKKLSGPVAANQNKTGPHPVANAHKTISAANAITRSGVNFSVKKHEKASDIFDKNKSTSSSETIKKAVAKSEKYKSSGSVKAVKSDAAKKFATSSKPTSKASNIFSKPDKSVTFTKAPTANKSKASNVFAKKKTKTIKEGLNFGLN